MCDWGCHDPTKTAQCAALKSLLYTEVCDAEHTYNAAITSVQLRRKGGGLGGGVPVLFWQNIQVH